MQRLLCRLAAEDLLRQESVGVAQGGQQPRVEVQQLVADQVLDGVCGKLRPGLGRELRLRELRLRGLQLRGLQLRGLRLWELRLRDLLLRGLLLRRLRLR